MPHIKLIKECQQTGEDWAIYEVQIEGSWDWLNAIDIDCYISDNRIDFSKPIYLSAH